MGWKGTVRTFGAAVRAAEREAKRRQRELEKQHKKYEKMQELEQASYEVEVYENHIDVIQSVHKECSVPVNWQDIVTSKGPNKPEKLQTNEQIARMALEKYNPGFIDKIFKREEKKKTILNDEIENSAKRDKAEYESNLVSWERDFKDWKESVEVANSLLKGDKRAKIEAINNLNSFSEISNLGSNISILVDDKGIVEATIHVHGVDIVPTEEKRLLKSGKLSIKKMPKGRFYEIYQDYVCSSVLRVANEIFSSIPDKIVIVTAVDEILNSKTGHLETSPILSVCVSRNTLQKLNLDKIDPSDSMDNFIHNMAFKKTKGFDKVSRVEPSDIDL